MDAAAEPDPAEEALLAGRRRGVVDEELLVVLRGRPLLTAVQTVEGQARHGVQEVAGAPAVVAWTSRDRARGAGWTGDLAEQTGAALAASIAGSGLSLAVNVGEAAGVHLGPQDVARLAVATTTTSSALHLGAPTGVPPALTLALARALAALPVLDARLATVSTGTAPGDLVVVLTPRPGITAAQRSTTAGTLSSALGAAGVEELVDVAFLDQLGALRDAARRLPVFYRA